MGSDNLKAPRRANTEILDHNRKREVELKALLTQYASNECADDDGVADGFV